MERIVITAAKIVRAEIRDKEYNSDSYSTNDYISNIEKSREWMPRHLQILMKTIVSSEQKQNSIGQCIVQAARSKSVIALTLFGLGVELDHVFGSRWLINELLMLGFSITYEVNRYKQSVIQSESLENLLTEYPQGTFTQWVADNIGARLFVITYGGKQEDALNNLRYMKFMEMVLSSKASLDLQKLPPTERAAHYYSLQVHLQVII